VDALAPPYPPSWYDRLQDSVERRTGVGWVFWVIAGIVIAVAFNGIAWVLGYVPVGVIDPYITSGGPYLVIGYGGMHYLDTAAGRAWRTFRPATGLDDDEAARFGYELTTMPARPAIIATLVGLVVAGVYLVSQYGHPFDLETQPVLYGLVVVIVTVGFMGTVGMLYHSVRQLRVISRAHRYLLPIDPLHLTPLHAFAGVTAATGIVLLAIGYLAIPTNPVSTENPAVLAAAIATSVLAVACFIVPLLGIHATIAAAKATRLTDVNRLLAVGLTDLHERAERRDLSDADVLDKQLASLLAERQLVAAAPTRPWDPQTLRGFSAAVIIPIALWLTYRLLERSL
jgi:hypothetical protein